MNSRTRVLLLLTAGSIGLLALTPASTGENRPASFGQLVQQTEARIGRAAASVGYAVYGALLPFPGREQSVPGRDKPVRAESEALPPIGEAAALPQAVQDGSALRQAYLVAAADGRMRDLGYDPSGIEDALAAYRSGDLARGDAVATRLNDPTVRTALEWLALREVPGKISLARLQAFRDAHAAWPAKAWLRQQSEARLFFSSDAKAVERFFVAAPPVTVLGKLALAKALKADDHPSEAGELARAVFRDSELGSALEARFKTEFGGALSKADYKYRADKLLYKDQIAASMRYAALAGGDVLALERARVALLLDVGGDKALAAVPETLRNDPGLILAQVQKLRREDKLMEAAQLMQSAPRDAASLIEGDNWWTERRVLARRLLDAGNVNAAYVVCATHSAAATDVKVEAEFHAGWIALRFMNDPARATYHFGRAAKLADGPSSTARIAYWQARTAEAAGETDRADGFYRAAAEHGSTFYGQLARRMLGITATPVTQPPVEATAGDRDEAIRVIELLYAANARDAASALAIDAAQSLTDGRQARALASLVRAQGDAHIALTVGKLLGQRGLDVDTLAFPTFGIPLYQELQNSAPRPVVYAIARQESAFMPAVVSKAGAKGLMQIIDATARHTATKAGLPFDPARLTGDPAFNAQLGAAHLGELLAEQNGSLILTFAAYNAGGGRVKQWIDAYGDPRSPGVDPVDWIERIPFTETRNYVQRVMANVAMYEAIFAEEGTRVAVSPVPPAQRQAKL